jgi:drug/metabolite transporter (DMT)-like permease
MLGVLAFSLTLPVTRIALQGFSPWTVAFGRTAIAGLVALVVLRLARAPRPTRAQVPALLATTAGVVIGFPLLTTVALQSTSAADAAVVIAALPIATAVLAVLRTRERMGGLFWACSTIGTLAVAAFAVTRGGGDGASLPATLMLLGAVLAAAVGYNEGGRLSGQVPGWVVISWALVVALPVTVPLLGVSLAVSPAAPSWSTTGALLFLALVPQYLGFFAFYAGLARAGVARASQTQLLQPLLTLVWSVLLIGEAVSVPTLLAALVVVASVAGTQRARQVAPPPGD